MKWLQLVPAALLLIACGGRSAQPTTSPNLGGAAGEPGTTAGTTSVAAAGEGGAAGPSAGGVDGDAAGAAGAGLGEAGAGGQACAGLVCLAGAEFVYVPDREWQRPAASESMTDELSEADYQPLLGPTWLAQFSIDALSVDLTPVAGGATVHGTRDQKRDGRAWFDLVIFAGGRFVVEVSSKELHAEYTSYGSGAPIISSTRGLLKAP